MDGQDLFRDDVAEFNYSGGSNPGKKRLVYVTATGYNDTVIDAWDFEKQVYRTFAKSKISNVQLRHEIPGAVKRVSLSDLPPNFTSLETLAKLFEEEGRLCYIDPFAKIVVSVKPLKKEPEMTANVYVYDKVSNVTVFDPDHTLNVYLNVYMGKCLGLYVKGGVITLHHGATKIENPTVAEFATWAKSLGDK